MTILCFREKIAWLLFLLFPFQQSLAANDQWITLGTSGGPMVQLGAAQISNALVVNENVYLFDVGDGVRAQIAKAKLQDKNLKAIFLSHHHSDHNADLSPVVIEHWLFHAENAINIAGPAGTLQLVNGIVKGNAATELASFATIGPARPPLANCVNVNQIDLVGSDIQLVYQDDHIRVSAINVDHFQQPPSVEMTIMPKALAYKIETPSRVIVYSGDTGFSENLLALAKNADLLITEVVDFPQIEKVLAKRMMSMSSERFDNLLQGLSKNHLSPTDIAYIGNAAKVPHIVLTHFVPLPEDALGQSKLMADVKKSYKGKVSLAKDLAAF